MNFTVDEAEGTSSFVLQMYGGVEAQLHAGPLKPCVARGGIWNEETSCKTFPRKAETEL
jgi:hypothetical protein